jgi:hypothetical protein
MWRVVRWHDRSASSRHSSLLASAVEALTVTHSLGRSVFRDETGLYVSNIPNAFVPWPRGRAMTIDSRTLYTTLLGLKAPWEITDVELTQPPGEVHIRVALPEGTLWVCPQCQSAAPIHDHQERHWRHLDTCQFPTFVHTRVPRLKCVRRTGSSNCRCRGRKRARGSRQCSRRWRSTGSGTRA